MTWFLELTSPLAININQTGGKGASLARLYQAHFPVPDAIIIPSTVFQAFIANFPDLSGAIANLNFSDPMILNAQAKTLRQQVEALPFPGGFEETLSARLASLIKENAVAVRSSSTMEDLVGAAFAGQHDTFLHLTSVASVLKGIKACYGSLFEDRALLYRQEKGFDHLQAHMAVVIQKMVNADVAGVAFTMDPVDGNFKKLIINAAFGLGETVVSGEGEVDQFTVEKVSGNIIKESIGQKTHYFIGSKDGTSHEALPPEKQNAKSLDESQIKALTTLCVHVEEYYGFVQDIEWAIENNQLFLLQSRPITHFPQRWTRDESAERFPNAITPLTWDYVFDGFHRSLTYSLKLMKLPVITGKWFERFNGYIYGNQTVVELFVKRPIYEISSLETLTHLIPIIREQYRWVQELPLQWARDLDGYLFKLGALSAVDLNKLDDEALVKHVDDIHALGSHFFLPNIAISLTHGFLHRALFQFLCLLFGKEVAPALYDKLTSFCETKTSVVNADLQQLASLVLKTPKLKENLINMDRKALWESGDLNPYSEFNTLFHKFLFDHGHREVDFDVYHPTWVLQPWIVLENLRLIALKGSLENLSERETVLREQQFIAEQQLYEKCPAELQLFASELIRLARLYTSLDDLEHYQTSRLSVPFRAGLLEIGKRWTQKGYLENSLDIFFVHKKDIDDALTNKGQPLQDLKESVNKEKQEYKTAANSSPAWNLDEPNEATTTGLVGIPGSGGIAEGTVCIVLSPEDFQHFKPGSILVTRTTNPAWTPLFYSASAVVTESGGPLSHGAVTAREVGIPAVMAVRDVLQLLKNGQHIRVNGTQGTVEELE